MVWALFVQAGRNALAIDGVHPGKPLRNSACLVGLQLTDEVPGEIQVGEAIHLAHGFLRVALAEIPLAAFSQRPNAFRRVRLAHGDEGDRLLPPAISHCSGCDALPGFFKAFP